MKKTASMRKMKEEKGSEAILKGFFFYKRIFFLRILVVDKMMPHKPVDPIKGYMSMQYTASAYISYLSSFCIQLHKIFSIQRPINVHSK